MKVFLEEGNWEEFINLLGLAIYGVILLPHLDEYVDLALIDIFLANQERARNLVTAVLANTYYTINRCHERKGGCLAVGKSYVVPTQRRINDPPHSARVGTTPYRDTIEYQNGLGASHQEGNGFGTSNQVESAQLPFNNFPPVDDVAQRPNLVKGKEIVEGGSKEEDLKRELEAAYEG
ncbi:hypothetical protein CR513_38359, partial [Mucuna pruriens]